MNTSLRMGSMTRERNKVRNQTRPTWYLVKELSSRGRNQEKIPWGASFSNLPLRSRYTDCLPMGKKWQFRDTHCFASSHPCHPLYPWFLLWLLLSKLPVGDGKVHHGAEISKRTQLIKENHSCSNYLWRKKG